MDDTVLESMACTLEESGRYRILRRLELATTSKPPHAAIRTAVIVDTETTGVRRRRHSRTRSSRSPC